MFLIAHRGNVKRSNTKLENSPSYILYALWLGFDVEIDVWFVNDKFYLGHDKPTYEIDIKFLQNFHLWCHAKNIEALSKMLPEGIHCFWHQQDDVTLTSRGYIWTYPKKQLFENSIAMIFDDETIDLSRCAGVCSDDILNIKELEG